MFVEKIKDDTLRNKMEALMQLGRNLSPDLIKKDSTLLAVFPYKDDYAVWVPTARVVKIGKEIGARADMVLPSQVLDHFIEKASRRIIMNFCPCREMHSCKDHPVEYGCIFLGDAAKDIHPELGRPADVDETLDYARRCREAGLIHHVGYVEKDSLWLEVSPSRRLLTVCNCCSCCCAALPSSRYLPIHQIRRMPGVRIDVADRCTGCGACVVACKFQAIKMKDDHALVTHECVACGLCTDLCPEDAIEITIDDPEYMEKTIQRISKEVDCT